ncbi:MAG: ABC transporter permease [Anaerolineae bacterium]|nr:ABC transporter permease [Anaerolineae bacterium]
MGELGLLGSLARRNVAKHRLRSLLTGLAISLGVGTALAGAIVGQAAGRQAGQVSAQGTMANTVLVQAGLLAAGGLLLFASCFIILNAFGMSLAQRMHDIGTLRAVGMTRRQMRQMVLAEAALLGLAGAAGGIAAGLGLGWIVMRGMGNLAGAPLQAPWWGLVLSPLLGVAVTVTGALQPAWRAGRVTPLAAIRPLETLAAGWYLRRGGRLGMALLVLTVLAATALGLLASPTIWASQAANLAAQAALLAAAVLLLPALIDRLAALCRPFLARRLGVAGRLAAGNAGRNRLRAALTAGAMTAGLVAIVATSGLMTAGLKGGLRRFGAMLHEDLFVVHDLPLLVASGKLSVENFYQFIAAEGDRFELDPVVDALQPLVESGAIQIERHRFVTVPPELAPVPGSPAIAVDPETFLEIGNFDFYEGDAQAALAWIERGPAVLIQPVVAERLRVRVGDAIPVQTRQGIVDFTVAGIGGSGWNMTVMPYDQAVTYLGATGPTHIGIVARDRSGVDAALAQVRQAISPFAAQGVIAYHYDNFFDPLTAMVGRLERLIDGLLLLAVAVAGLGVVNATVVNVAERRREIGLLRAVGATRGQVRRAVVAEAALLGLIAAIIAGGLGLLMLFAWLVLTLPNGTTSVGVRPDWTTVQMVALAAGRDLGMAWAAALIGGPLVAGLAAYLPARAAAAMNVVEAARYE